MEGAREWTIRKWDEKWHEPGDGEQATLSDRLLVTEFLERNDRHFTIAMRDGGKFIGGQTLIRHGNEAVGMCSYRDPQYDWHGLGFRMNEFSYQWGSEAGLDAIDMGGAFPHHKERWGPQDGTKWEVTVCGELNYRMGQIGGMIWRIRSGRIRSGQPITQKL